MTRVAVDALGGDNAPSEVILGALDAAAAGIDVVLYGPAHLDTQGLPLVETTDVIEMGDKPTEAVRAKPDSSLVAAVRAVADHEADAVVSAGNTGAMLAPASTCDGCLVDAAPRSRSIPARGPSVLIDAGANADARPDHLADSRTWAPCSAEVLGVQTPGSAAHREDEKGNQRRSRRTSFAGRRRLNLGSRDRDLLRGADVVVTDGFTGGIAEAPGG